MEYRLIRSDRRTLALSVEADGGVTARAPLRLPRAEIDRFVESHAAWIERHRAQMRLRAGFERQHFGDPADMARLRERAKDVLPEMTAHWAARMGVKPASVRITDAKTRFGSCSAKDAICFSCRLMAFPDDAVEYVVVHELAHILKKNHSPAFYAIVARYLPDYRRREALLRRYTDEKDPENPDEKERMP